jgi:hypothetical protein
VEIITFIPGNLQIDESIQMAGRKRYPIWVDTRLNYAYDREASGSVDCRLSKAYERSKVQNEGKTDESGRVGDRP